LNAISPQASRSSASWFSGFFDQRIGKERLRLSRQWQASTSQRRARDPDPVRLRSSSSLRRRMRAV
jgi:hypothetical protein